MVSMIFGLQVLVVTVVQGLMFQLTPEEPTHCIQLLPHDKRNSAEGSFVIGDNRKADFSVTIVGEDGGEQQLGENSVYRRYYKNSHQFEVEPPFDAPIGFSYMLCWTISNAEKDALVYFKIRSSLISSHELGQSSKELDKISRMLQQFELQLDQENSDFRQRTDYSESTLSEIFILTSIQTFIVILMAFAQAKTLRKLFETRVIL